MDPLDRLLKQLKAFHDITVECSRCKRQISLGVGDLQPTARGLHCRRCLVGMDTAEFRKLERENEALAHALSP